MPEMEIFKELIQSKVIESKAKIAVELGVGKGESTRIILEALKETGGELHSFDIVPASIPLDTEGWHFSQNGGLRGFVEWEDKPIEFLFVDTDPHDFDQTLMWCLSWFEILSVGGVSLWHDTELKRGNVDVRGALEFYSRCTDGVDLAFIEESYGMGVMEWRK